MGDRHTSDIGHWFAMTAYFCTLNNHLQSIFSIVPTKWGKVNRGSDVNAANFDNFVVSGVDGAGFRGVGGKICGADL